MRGGARLVHSVDSSAKAVELTRRNVELNFPGDRRHKAFCEDAFKFLELGVKSEELGVQPAPQHLTPNSSLLTSAASSPTPKYFTVVQNSQKRPFALFSRRILM